MDNTEQPPSLFQIIFSLLGASGIMGILISYIDFSEKYGIINTILSIFIIIFFGVIVYIIWKLIYYLKIKKKYFHIFKNQPRYIVQKSRITIEINDKSDLVKNSRLMVIQDHPDIDHAFIDHLYVREKNKIQDIFYESTDARVIKKSWEDRNNLAIQWIPKTTVENVPSNSYSHQFKWKPNEYNIHNHGEWFMAYPSAETGYFELDIISSVPIKQYLGFYSKKRCLKQNIILTKALDMKSNQVKTEIESESHIRFIVEEPKSNHFYYFTWFYEGKIEEFRNDVLSNNVKKRILEIRAKRL